MRDTVFTLRIRENSFWAEKKFWGDCENVKERSLSMCLCVCDVATIKTVNITHDNNQQAETGKEKSKNSNYKAKTEQFNKERGERGREKIN